MTHPAKAKGNADERAVVDFLRQNEYPLATRMRSGWKDDKGDIEGVPDTCIEVKAERRTDLAGYMRELATEMENARATTGVVVVKKRGANVSEWYACAPLHLWVTLLRESGR